ESVSARRQSAIVFLSRNLPAIFTKAAEPSVQMFRFIGNHSVAESLPQLGHGERLSNFQVASQPRSQLSFGTEGTLRLIGPAVELPPKGRSVGRVRLFRVFVGFSHTACLAGYRAPPRVIQ